jgi:hypothetical protein
MAEGERDILTMQEEAKRRVMEMRSRSRFAAEQMNRSLGAPPPEKPAVPEPPPAPREDPAEELERLFILSLCLLLAHEEADRSVLLGLMYLLT